MRNRWRTGLTDFSDCLLAGLLVALASAPVVTAAPAFAAGCRVLDRARHGLARPLWTTFWADFRQAARGGVPFALGCLAVAVLFAVDLEVAGSMAGAGVLRTALWLLAAAAAVVAVRTCAVFAAGEPSWRRAIAVAARETAASPGHALLLAGAAGLAVVLVWMLPILALVVAGPLALAAVATGGRA
ncbi:DUF624 domain-containing protein [Amycolatopsis australiensis]|uniref:DUF624 domain-containing protein n=1 Tax=Amycolatopsis australiensis TaxID=546364 RepID=A0A1K1SH79_9PSEU|nr:DUF624 domain-containing protein [Amycolatopsis australiensis]SFW83731.1 Protein of unknown function, DUF624 [Amycolatopsis australiensis]